MPTVKDIIDRLHRQWNPDEHIAVAIWSEVDVLERAEEKNMAITREGAREIIRLIDDKQDCSIGITWDTIDVYLDGLEYSPQR